MFTEYPDRHSNFVVLVVCYEQKAAATSNNSKFSSSSMLAGGGGGTNNMFHSNPFSTTTATNNSSSHTNGGGSGGSGKQIKIIRKWNEFKLPLDENKVTEWSKLPNNSLLKYYHVPTFKHCIEQGINFVNFENHVINDQQVLYRDQLMKRDCYFVFTSDTYSIDYDPKKEVMKHQMISNFNTLFETNSTETSTFYLEASDYDFAGAVKNYYASQRGVKSLEDLFLLHAKNGRTDLLSLLLNLDFDKSCSNNLGMNALHLSVRYGHFDCVKLLLQSKFKNQLNEKDRLGNYPIHIASMGSSESIFELLIKETRDLAIKNGESETIFHTFCKGEANVEIFEMLFSKICEFYDEDFTKYARFFNLNNDDNETAFMMAVRKNHFHFVQHVMNSQLFSSLINFNVKNKLRQSVLIVASKEDAFQTLQILLSNSNCLPTLMDRDERDLTALHYATLFSFEQVSNLLLQYTDIQQYNTILLNGKITPIQYSIFQNNLAMVKVHINYLANNNSLVVSSLANALCLCIKYHRSIEIVKELLKYQVDINQNFECYHEYSLPEKTTYKFPLLDCILSDSKTIFKFLLRQPTINVNQQSKETGMTSLHYAIIKHYLTPTEHSKYFIMKLIKKCNLTLQDFYLRTALHLSNLCDFKDVSESIVMMNRESETIKDLNDIPSKDVTKDCTFANNLLVEKYSKYITLVQAHATNYKLYHGAYLQYEILNFLYDHVKLNANEVQSIYKRVSQFQKYLPAAHFVKHINLPILPQLLNFKYENGNLHLIYTSNTVFDQTSSCRFYLDRHILTHPVHQFSTMLKIVSSIYVLHYANIVHGNIKANTFRFVNDSKLLYIYDYGLFFNQLDDKIMSPEMKSCKQQLNASSNELPFTKSNDIYNLGHLLYEIMFGSKLGEKEYSVTPMIQPLYEKILSCFNENEEFRPTIKELYDILKGSIHKLIVAIQESNSQAAEQTKILDLELQLTDIMISRYGYNDHLGKPHEMNNTQNISKCITKINELVKSDQLAILNDVFNQLPLPEQLDASTVQKLFGTIHYLIQTLNDKFKPAAFDLLRVLLLKKECVEYLLTDSRDGNLTLMNIEERMKNIGSSDAFALTLISSCLAHCLIYPIGLNYFTNQSDKYDLLINFMLQLLNSNQEKNAFNAAMILHNLRFNVQRIGVQYPPILSEHLSYLAQTKFNFPFIEKSERSTRLLLETCVASLNRFTASLKSNTIAAEKVSVVKDTIKYISLSLYSITKLDSNCTTYLTSIKFNDLESFIDSKLYTALFHLASDFTEEETEYLSWSKRVMYKPGNKD